MRQGFRNYSVFSYRPMSASGGTVSDLSINGRLYRKHVFPTSSANTLVIHNQGDEPISTSYTTNNNVVFSSTAPSTPGIMDVWINSSNTNAQIFNGDVVPITSISGDAFSSNQNNYQTKLSYSVSYNSLGSIYSISYSYFMITGPSTFMTNLPASAWLNIDNQPVFSQVTNFTFPANSQTLIASGTITKPFNSLTENKVVFSAFIDGLGSGPPPQLTIEKELVLSSFTNLSWRNLSINPDIFIDLENSGANIAIRYPVGPYVPYPAMTANGGTTLDYTVGSITYRSHTFTNVGTSTFTVSSLGAESWGSEIEYMIIAGGGSGGSAGAGAGGAIVSSATISPGQYTITVGAGGPNNYAGTPSNGGNSSIVGAGITTSKGVAIGGGLGGSFANNGNGNYGGSGGGASVYWNGSANAVGTRGLGEPGQGNRGSTANAQYNGNGSGGGAGGEGTGYLTTGEDYMGNNYFYWVTFPGIGIANTYQNGTTQYYAGGGVGADIAYVANTIYGGGGTNGAPSYGGISGRANSGGGGGGGLDYQGGGGSGIVVIRYRIA